MWIILLFSATTVPDPSQPAGAIGTLAKHPSLDSAYAEGGKAHSIMVVLW